tara:strand:- start:30 stop:614 length:585 start_codon:yes stop_codon:yes gene_type:complete
MKINYNRSNEYLAKQNYNFEKISRGNTCLDDLEKEAHVYIGHYTFTSIKEFSYYNYSNDERTEDGYYLSPYSKEMTLIVFSKQKFEQLILYPDLGLSKKKLKEIYSSIIENKERKANLKHSKEYLNAWLNDNEDLFYQMSPFMEDNRYFPSCIEDFRQDIYELNLPSFDINIQRYRGDIIPVEDSNTKNKEADM